MKRNKLIHVIVFILVVIGCSKNNDTTSTGGNGGGGNGSGKDTTCVISSPAQMPTRKTSIWLNLNLAQVS